MRERNAAESKNGSKMRKSDEKIVAFLKEYRTVCEKYRAYITGGIGAITCLWEMYPHQDAQEEVYQNISEIIRELYDETGNSPLSDRRKNNILKEVYP